MVLATYSDLRHHFALTAATSGVSLTFTAATSTIARASGSFATDGFEVDMTLDAFGTTLNDGRYTLSAVSALSMTVVEALADETVTGGLFGAFYEADGMAEWPRASMHTSGFDAAPPSRRNRSPRSPSPSRATQASPMPSQAPRTSGTSRSGPTLGRASASSRPTRTPRALAPSSSN